MRGKPPELSDRFLAAVSLAQEVHGQQWRSGTEIPFVAHLLVVTGLVIEDGGGEEDAIAAILHDAVEDGGGLPMLDRLDRTFGPRVAEIVAACSDNLEGDPSDSWLERKRRYLDHLPDVEDDAILRVALADKVHNARSIVRDYRESGQALWERFTQKTARDQLWYYGGLLDFFERRRPGQLTEDLWRAVGELAWLVARDEAARSDELLMWLDADLYRRQAPEGWIQVRSSEEGIQLLTEYRVGSLSLSDTAELDALIEWLAGAPERRPAAVRFHGEPSAEARAKLAAALERPGSDA